MSALQAEPLAGYDERSTSDLSAWCARLAVYPILNVARPWHEVEAWGAALLGAGARVLQVRDKSASGSALVRACRRLRPMAERAGAWLIVNDRLDIAWDFADGVHLGQKDGGVASARWRARSRPRIENQTQETVGLRPFLVGASVQTPDEARRAWADGADYLSASPVFGTPTKANAGSGIGLAGVSRLRAALPGVPLVAIGGMRGQRIAAVVAAGADGVAYVAAPGAPSVADARSWVALGRQARVAGDLGGDPSAPAALLTDEVTASVVAGSAAERRDSRATPATLRPGAGGRA